MQNPELLELTASEPLTLKQEYEMQQSWFQDEDKCTFIILDKKILEDTKNEIDPSHRSKGKGKEALLFMLRYGTEALSITKFTAKIKMKNNTSLKLFSNIGFAEVNRSEVFLEIEMVFESSKKWRDELISKTQMYKIENYI
ncbi:unnamed protein product [Larinioides sclopetarius]|uniref:N-acetyltransferase domain-containing protein n=1 Tax=Larinioides sclopetarius TaxID=280406 RepID=A0AAV1ZWJ0_9ARAC